MPFPPPDDAVLAVAETTCSFEPGHFLAITLALWKEWTGDARAPTWRDVKLYELPPVILRQTLVADVLDGGTELQYRFWGSDYTENYGIDGTGKRLHDFLSQGFAEATMAQCRQVIESGEPRCFHVTIRSPLSGMVQTKTNLRLPVMDEPGVVTKIVTATIFDEIDLG